VPALQVCVVACARGRLIACHLLAGALLAPGETVTWLSHQPLEPEGPLSNVEVTCELNRTAWPCGSGDWVPGAFMADTGPLPGPSSLR
jgi:hypothetical protein